MNHIDFDISRGDIRRLERTLRRLGNEAFPRIIRNTLNSTGFLMMGGRGGMRLIEKHAGKEFKYIRNKTFIRSLSTLEKASGNDIDTMKTFVGIAKKSGKNKAAAGLEKQTEGKDIKHGFAPLDSARISQSTSKRVMSRAKADRLPQEYTDLTNKSKGEIMPALHYASQHKGTVLIRGRKGANRRRKYVAQVMKRQETLRSSNGTYRGKKRYKLRFLYKQNEGGVAKIDKKRPFLYNAAKEAFKHSDEIFYKEANRVLNRLR